MHKETTTPSVLVIIVTWNKAHYVLNLLASLSTLDYPRSLLDIVVVDNASEDDTVAAINSRYPDVTLLCNSENLGGTGGFNTGLQWAFQQPLQRYQYLWLLDNDVVVHQQALTALVNLLESKPDIAVAGSTMMQLDFPWRINEMGAFLDRTHGTLLLNRHLEEIPAWQGRAVPDLLCGEVDLSQQLLHCQPYMDVDYVAAASLVVRASVAREAGLWRDYFIHFDDVEWCLRIAGLGQRVVVSAQSLIWHLSAAAKVPTWVLYYDNRNILDLLQVHGADAKTLRQLTRYILKKAVYYHLIGKADLARLHHAALDDFAAQRFGKQPIALEAAYTPHMHLQAVLQAPAVRRILLSGTVDLQAAGIQEVLVQAQLRRPELQIDCVVDAHYPAARYPLPRCQRLVRLPRGRLGRWWRYWRLRGRYDMVIQSDYQVVIGLSWLGAELLFVNQDSFSRRPPPQWQAVWQAGWRWLWG